MKTIFIDQNQKLVDKIKKAIKYLPEEFNVSAKCGDIFKEKGVIVSASNPDFTCGGGLDLAIVNHGNRPPKKKCRKGNIIWAITVDKNIKSSRELVAKALKFAISKTKKNETLLVSGLGTGIGGLELDDFVWLFLQAIINSNKKWGWGIKYTKKNGYDFHTGRKHYQVGKWLEEPSTEHINKDCGIGLHLGKSFAGAGNYNLPEKIYFCIFKISDKYGDGSDKVRVQTLLPLYICPRWLGYGPNGKLIINKIGKKINPEKYNPYQATKLPSKEELKKGCKKLSQVWGQVGDQVWDQVWDQVGDQVWDQVRGQVWGQVWGQVGDQVWDHVRDQVWDQVRATSYWAIKLYLNLPINHWFGDFLKLGVMIAFVQGKVKVFGKKGKFLGEYDESEIL